MRAVAIFLVLDVLILLIDVLDGCDDKVESAKHRNEIHHNKQKDNILASLFLKVRLLGSGFERVHHVFRIVASIRNKPHNPFSVPQATASQNEIV